jgi:alanine racemase
MPRPTHIVIDHGALRHNLHLVRRAAPGRRVMAVVKADGYGHGVTRVARTLAAAGADGFGVASPAEAEILRRGGIHQPITLLEGHFEDADLDRVAQLGLGLMIHHQWQVQSLMRARPRRPVRVWIKVDTGMHRLGFVPEELPAVVRRLGSCAAVAAPLGLASHLACADQPDNADTQRQIRRFGSLSRGWPGVLSLANSAAVLAWPAAQVGWLRPGIMLYGVSPFPDRAASGHGLRPVMHFRSRLIAVRRCAAGDRIGYGGTWVCPEPMPVGVVAAGYGDGYPRHAPSGTPVLVGGTRVPLIGRVSMDMIGVDLRPRSEAKVGDPVVLWGEGLPVEEIAAAAGTIAYELLCLVTPRVRVVEAGL